MRIVLVGPVAPWRGGIAHYTTMLYSALQARGHSIVLVSFKRQYPKWLFPGRSDRDPSLQQMRIDEARYWMDSMNPFTWVSTFRRMRHEQPDALILQWWTSFWAPAWLCLAALNRLHLRRPLLFICHNVLPHEVRAWDRWTTRMVLRMGSGFLVHSPEERERLLSLLHTARVAVSPIPAFDMWADQRLPRQEARQRLGLPLDGPILLFFGIVREYKGLDDLIRALPDVRRHLGAVTLVVAGEFWEDRRAYQQTIRALDLESSVHIDDRYIPNEEVPLYFSAADLLVAPYRRVTASAVVQMALSFGLPAITTRPGSGQRACPGEAGLDVPAGDWEALAASIVRFFREGRAEPMREELERQRNLFSWDHLAASLEELAR